MKKMMLLFILLLLIGTFGYNLFFNKSIDASHSIEKEAIQDKDFLKNKQAVMYFSTTADQDIDDKGISLAVFINDKGKAEAYRMKGLELGSLSFYENELMLVDKNTLKLVGKAFKEFKMNKPQYTGERTGYLKKEDFHISIFNTGVNKDGGYDSNIWFGNISGVQSGNIPYYILASGITNNEVLILTQDTEKNQYALRKVLFTKNKMNVQDLITLHNPQNSEFSVRSPILSDSDYYYFILSEFIDDTSENTVLFRIHRKTLAQEKILLDTYTNKQHPTAAIPYNVKNSAHIYNHKLYYINGLGEVITFDTQSKKANLLFTLKDAPKDGVRHNEETFFKDDSLYVVRYSEKSPEKHILEKHSLNSGKKMDSFEIKGLHDILTSVKGKSIYSYDFKWLR
jgi:hypothetical protein